MRTIPSKSEHRDSAGSLSRNNPPSDPLENYKPKTELGKVLLEARAKFKASGKLFLTIDEIDDLVGRKPE